ncbi:MAG: AAA family ATPase [Candidatus Aenigmatarchaeota archaeon]
MITGLKLKNWKSHLESGFEFGKGTNVLVGIMGSGKSSVLSAISFALFGTFPSHRSREVTLDGMIMNRPQKKQESEVVLEMKVDGDEFQIRRKIEREKGTTEADIRKNGELLDTGASRVTELVEKYLKVDYNLFSRAVYSEQDGLDNFLEIRKGERMKKIDDLLQIDRFEECRSNVTTLINRLGDRIDSKRDMIEEMESEEDFNRIKELEEEIKEIKNKIKDMKEELEKINKNYESTKNKVEEIRKGIEKVNKLEKKKSKLEGSISSVKSDINSLKEEIELGEKEIKEKIENKEENIKELEGRKKKLEDEVDGLEDEEKDRKVKIKDFQKRIQKLKGVEGDCPVCGNDLDEEHKQEVIEERMEKISKLSKEKEGLVEKINEKKEKVEGLEEKIEEREKEKQDLEKRLERTEELDEKEDVLEDKEEKLKEVEQELEKKGEKFDEEKGKKMQEELNELSGRREKVKTEIKNKRKFLEEREEEKEELEEREERFEKHKEDIKSSKTIKEDLEKFRTALKSTQKQLRRRFIEAVNETLRKVWSSLYPYDDFTDVRFTIVEGDYELQFKSAGNWQSVEGIASGGERTSACLALRIAFALVLAPNLKWLVLDEPTHNLDRQAVEDLSELLRTEISRFVDQVFLITHDETMESAANAYLYKLERNKQRNGPTRIEEIT